MSQDNLNGDLNHTDFDNKSNSSVEDTNDSNNESNGLKSSELAKTLRDTGFADFLYGPLESVKNNSIGCHITKLADSFTALAEPVLCSEAGKTADKIAAASVQHLSTHAVQTYTAVKQYRSQIGCTIEVNMLKADDKLKPVINILEDFLNKYILDETNREIQDNQQQQIIQTLRALQIAAATRDRCFEIVKRQLTTTQSYTADQLRQLQESNQLLSRATETVNTLNQSLLGMIVNLRETVQNPDLTVTLQAHLQNIAAVIYKDEENLPKAVQARIIDYSSALLAITDSIGNYIKLNAQHSPEYLQERLKPLVTFFEERYTDVVNEIKNGKGSPLDKAKNILQLTTNHTLPLLRSSLTDLQEAIQCYTNSLNTSLNNQLNSASHALGVK